MKTVKIPLTAETVDPVSQADLEGKPRRYPSTRMPLVAPVYSEIDYPPWPAVLGDAVTQSPRVCGPEGCEPPDPCCHGADECGTAGCIARHAFALSNSATPDLIAVADYYDEVTRSLSDEVTE